MALDLGLTTYQLLSALDGLAPNIQSRRRRLDDAIDRALAVPAGGAAFRTAAVGRRPYIAARTGPEGLLGSRPPPQVPQDWTALSVDGSHIDVDRHLPLRCHLINLGGCAITYGQNHGCQLFSEPTLAVDGSHIDVDRHLPLRCHLINLGGCAITYGQNHGCQLFSEPTLAVDDSDLYLRAPNGARGETLIAGPLLGALRTVREVERLADAVENLPDDRPVLALLDGTLAFWDLQRGNYPRYVADVLIAERLMLCEQADADCNRLCTARHSDLTSCDGAAGFDDRELFELVLGPGHRSPLYRSSHLAAPFALGLATGQEWSHFYYLNGGAEIARVEVPDWLADDPELLALSHAMLVKQCQLGLGYPVAVSEAHEQAVITGHDREEFRRLTLMLLEQQGLPTPESAKATSKRRPWV